MKKDMKVFKLKKTNDDMLTIVQKKLSYIEMGKEIYPNAKEMTLECYNNIRNDLISGDATANKRLLEYSINAIIESTANIYARFEVEDILPFEEALSVLMYKYYKIIKNFTTIPNYYSKYKNSLVNYYVYKIITNQYLSVKIKKDRILIKPINEIYAEMDKDEIDEFTCEDLAKEEFTKRLNKTLKKLKSKNAEMLLYRYGFKTGEVETYEVLGEIFGMTHAGAEYVIEKTIKKLRKPENCKQLMLYSDTKLEI